MNRYRDELAARLHGTSPSEADAIARSVLSKMAGDEYLSAALWRSNLMTHMAGQMFIRDIEVPKTTLALAADVPETFLQLPFDEAIQHFLARGIMPAEEFYALSDAERFRSFTMAQAVSDASIGNAQSLLATAFSPGGVGLDQFIADMQDDAVSLGFTPNSQFYLENVYRTSTATSYNAGRLRQQTDPDVLEAGGIWEYMTAEDSRVRTSHAALQGMQFEPNDPKALSIYPPNGFSCRCAVLTLDREEANPAMMNRDVPEGAVDTGFFGPPDETIQREASA